MSFCSSIKRRLRAGSFFELDCVCADWRDAVGEVCAVCAAARLAVRFCCRWPSRCLLANCVEKKAKNQSYVICCLSFGALHSTGQQMTFTLSGSTDDGVKCLSATAACLISGMRGIRSSANAIPRRPKSRSAKRKMNLQHDENTGSLMPGG